jgi:hypothetical protein
MDAPSSPEACQNRSGLNKSTAVKFRYSKPKAGPYYPNETSSSRPQDSVQTRHRPSISVKRISRSQDTDNRKRRNSITGTFVVPDNIVYLDTDTSSSDTGISDHRFDWSSSDIEILDSVPEDPENLRIDMLPRYAYNDRVLDKVKKK